MDCHTVTKRNPKGTKNKSKARNSKAKVSLTSVGVLTVQFHDALSVAKASKVPKVIPVTRL
jgi:hypothetical protein